MIRPTKPHSLPTFDSKDEERTYIKQRMAAAFRLFDKMGFGEGVAGHLTARDPERPDCFWVNPFGMSFGLIRASDLILVNHQGEVVEGDWPVNIAAFAIHSQVHQARPDVQAVVHDVFRHRLILSYDAHAAGVSANAVIDRLVQRVAVA